MADEELAQLRETFESYKASTALKMDKLDEENNVLATEMMRLKEENDRLKSEVGNARASLHKTLESPVVGEYVDESFVVASSDAARIESVAVTIPNSNSGTNALCARFSRCNSDLLVCGGVDKRVVSYNKAGEKLGHRQLPAPVLSLDVNPLESLSHLTLAGCMDGSHHLLSLDVGDEDTEGGGAVVADVTGLAGTTPELPIVQSFSDHTKYVISAKWSPDGRMFATTSHDKTVHIYSTQEDGSFDKVKTFNCSGIAESIEFLCEPALTLVIAVRDDNYLHYVDVATWEETIVNMNAAGDDHVSFNVLDLQRSPHDGGRYLLAATDRSRHIMFRAGTSKQVRNLYGHQTDDFSQPRLAWGASGAFAYSNTSPITSATPGNGGAQDAHAMFTWDLGTGLEVGRLRGHSALVRGLDVHPGTGELVSASYDKSVKIWR